MSDIGLDSNCMFSESDGCTGTLMRHERVGEGCSCFMGHAPCSTCCHNRLECTECHEVVDCDSERDLFSIYLYNFFLEAHPAHPRDLTASDVLRMTDEELEAAHDWVQWAFPLAERSSAVPDAPYLHDTTWKLWSQDRRIKDRVSDLAARYLKFLKKNRKTWTAPGDHNQLRITRMLKSTRIMLGDPAANLMYSVIRQMASKPDGTIPEHLVRPMRFWFNAVA